MYICTPNDLSALGNHRAYHSEAIEWRKNLIWKYQILSDISQTPDFIRGLLASKVYLKYKEG